MSVHALTSTRVSTSGASDVYKRQEEKFDVADIEEAKFRRMCMCDIFDTTGDAPWKPRKFQDDEKRHVPVIVIRTLPFVTEEPTVPYAFDPKLIRTSFDNLCRASYPIRTSFDNLWCYKDNYRIAQ